MTALHECFLGLTSDHLYADCPSRKRGEVTLRRHGWWGVDPVLRVDPEGTDICGLCVCRWRRKRAAA